jgi:hypothetical protein
MDDKARENHVKYVLNQKMLETGEKERLKEMLRQRLTESGWHEEGTFFPDQRCFSLSGRFQT